MSVNECIGMQDQVNYVYSEGCMLKPTSYFGTHKQPCLKPKDVLSVRGHRWLVHGLPGSRFHLNPSWLTHQVTTTMAHTRARSWERQVQATMQPTKLLVAFGNLEVVIKTNICPIKLLSDN